MHDIHMGCGIAGCTLRGQSLMRAPTGPIRGRCDGTDRLFEADEPLAGLQLRSGGDMPGIVAMPALLALVRKARHHNLRLSRTIQMLDDGHEVTTWASAEPDGAGGCLVELNQWRAIQPEREQEPVEAEHDLIRHLAEGTIWLDGTQRVLAADLQAADLRDMQSALNKGRGLFWTDFAEVEGNGHRQPLHWRLLDRAAVRIAGSERKWRAHIMPRPGLPGTGFELCLVPEEVSAIPDGGQSVAEPVAVNYANLLGRELAPALRQPIERILGHAESIRTRMAGPLTAQYGAYAEDIAGAGRHLLDLVEDLADLEAVESPGFRPAVERLDLAEVARRAGSMLAVRAAERSISLVLPPAESQLPATGEWRRVLQIVINLLSNAIRYSPEGTTVTISTGPGKLGGTAAVWLAVDDQGPGLDAEQAVRAFAKFERLGRRGDGGSGLGLYIARRLARSMGGELSVESAPGQGARFILTLPPA